MSIATLVVTTVPASAHFSGVSLTALGTPTIDGVLSPGEWDNADSINFQVNVPPSPGGGGGGGGGTLATLFVMNDADNLYLAVSFNAVTSVNFAAFEFDDDHGGAPRVNGDDIISNNPILGFRDQVRTNAPPCPPNRPPASCGFSDTIIGGTTDGSGAFSNGGGITVWEFSHPLDSADDAHDFSLSPGDTVGFSLFLVLGFPIVVTNFPASFAIPNSYGDIVIASSVVSVDIDIKPGSDPNAIQPFKMGVTPVVLLSSSTFSASTVDFSTVTFGPDDAIPVHKKPHFEDVNNDGLVDMVLHFKTKEIGIEQVTTELCLKAQTFGGTAVEGCDDIVVVPKS